MKRVQDFEYKKAKSILKSKGLLSEINDVLNKIQKLEKRQTHDEICGLLRQKGWRIKEKLLEETNYFQDAFKNGVMVEVDFSLIDSVHRNFLRAQELFKRGKIEVLVQIVPNNFEPKFDKMKRDIKSFKNALDVPIYLLGVS
jgi:hypothetical protein